MLVSDTSTHWLFLKDRVTILAPVSHEILHNNGGRKQLASKLLKTI